MLHVFIGKILANMIQVSDVAHGPLVTNFYTPVERRDVLCYGVVRPSVRPWSFQFSGLFFAIFAAIGLKLGVLLCSQELLFQFSFRID